MSKVAIIPYDNAYLRLGLRCSPLIFYCKHSTHYALFSQNEFKFNVCNISDTALVFLWISFVLKHTYWCFGNHCTWLNKAWHHFSYQMTICRHRCISTSLYLSVKIQHIFELSILCMPQSKVWRVMTENTLFCQAFVVCVVGLLQESTQIVNTLNVT